MEYGTLNKRHPLSDVETFQKYDALYKGGRAFRKLIGKFLPQNPLETSEVYNLRKKQAPFISYVGPIVDFFSAQLFSASFLVRATRDGENDTDDEFYATFRDDVDGCGTDLSAFLKERFTVVDVINIPPAA